MSQNPVYKRPFLPIPVRMGIVLLVVIAAFIAMPALVARADGPVVDTLLDDENDGCGAGNYCTLREAIAEPTADEGVTFGVTGVITLTQGQLNITQTLTISGPGAGSLAISGNNTYRVVNISSGVAVTITGVTLRDGNATEGGGIYNGGTLMLINSAIVSNTATGTTELLGGGGIRSLGSLTLNSSIVSNNHTESRGGGVRSAGALTILNSTISDNTADAHGGGIYNRDGIAYITNSTIINNIADYDNSGDLLNAGDGGGIDHLADAINASLTLNNSTIQGNVALRGGGVRNLGLGSDVTATMTISNSTVSGNTADMQGGGVLNAISLGVGSAEMNIINSTIVTNTADSDGDNDGDGGGIRIESNTTVNFENTIIADNADDSSVTIYPDCSGTLNSQDYNLIENATGCTINGTTTHNITGQDPNLGPLADNGGDTWTHALLVGSPAIDQGSCSAAADQRGYPRPVDIASISNASGGNGCDIGAYEAQTELALVKTVDDATPDPGQLTTFTIAIVNNGTFTATNGLVSDTLDSNLTFAGPITLDPPGAGTPGTTPPTLASGLTITPGERITITFPVTVNTGLAGGLVIANTAAVTSAEVSAPQTGAVEVTVNNVAPAASDASFSTDEETSLDDTLPASDDNGDILTFGILTGPVTGTIAIVDANAGSFIYTPTNLINSYTDTFTFIVTDTGNLSDMATVTVAVTADNDPPVAAADVFTVTEDSTDNALDVLSNDDDPEGDTLTVSAVGTPNHGGTAVNGNTVVTYTPAADFYGTETFTYTVGDGNGGFDTAVVTVNVTGQPDPPVAANDVFTVTEDSTDNVLDVLDNDDDPDGDTLTISTVGATDNGGTVVNGATVVTYTPFADFYGTETFTYTVSDGNGGFDTASVTVTVTAENDPPVAAADVFTVTEDSTDNVLDVLDNDGDVEGDPLTISAVGAPDHGGTAINGVTVVTYTPLADFYGTETFTYTVGDGNGGFDTASVTVNVTAENDPPVAAADVFTVTEDSTDNVLDVLDNDDDPDGDTLTISAVGATDNGGAAVNGAAVVTYTPFADFYGTETFTYTVSDGNGGFDTAAVTVNVTNQNDPPVADDDAFTVDEDSTTALDVLDNDDDIDGDTLTVFAVGTPDSGGTALNGATVVTYTPAADFYGTETFTYTVGDGNGGFDTATVTVNVTGVNDPPAAADDVFTVLEDSTDNVLDVLNNDGDVEGDTLTISAVGATDNGGTAINGATVVTYTPAADFYGTETFTYTVGDGNGGFDTATVTVNVTGVNDPPVANDDSGPDYTTDEDTVLTTGNVLDNDTDLDGDTLSVVGTSGTLGLVTYNGDGTFTFDPRGMFDYLAAGAQGFFTFTYTISDGNGGFDTASVTLTINGVNDAPTISNILNQSAHAGVPVGPISFTVGDVDTPVGTLTLAQASSNLALAPLESIVFGGSGVNRTVTITPTAGMSGTAVITITVSDGIASAYDAFVLSVDVNSPPEFTSTPIEAATVGVLYTYDITAADADAGDALTITAPVSASWLTLTRTSTRTATLSGTPPNVDQVPIELNVTDGKASAVQAFTITVTSLVNQEPVADAGTDQTVFVNTAVTLDGSGSADPDGNLPLTYGWTQTGGTPMVILSSNVISRPTFTAPGAPTVLTFTLVVTDALGLADPTPDTVVITVTEEVVNQAPVADAGADQTVFVNTAAVTLDGSGSTDPDDDLPLTYGWTQTGGPAVALSDSAAVAPTFDAPGAPTVLTFTLVVTDALGLADPTPDTVVITVTHYHIYLPFVTRSS